MSRRSLTLLASSAALGTTLALLPALAAHADGTVSMTVDPTHGVPGTALTASITVSGCSPDAVTVTGTYVNTDGEDATITPVQADNKGEGSWTAALAIPQDAARTSLSQEPLKLTATPDSACDPSSQPTSPPAGAPGLHAARVGMAAAVPTGTANVIIDDLAAAKLVVDPGSVKPGGTFDYTITGCVGGVADFYLEDNDGNDTDIPDSTVTSQPSATSFKGTMMVPAGATLGDAGVFLECTQAGSADAALLIFDDSGSGGGTPVAVPVTGRPHFTG